VLGVLGLSIFGAALSLSSRSGREVGRPSGLGKRRSCWGAGGDAEGAVPRQSRHEKRQEEGPNPGYSNITG
jgi:hypothetical protein